MRSRREVQFVARQEEQNSNENRTEPNSGAELASEDVRKMAMKEEVISATVGVKRIKQGDCKS